MGSLKETKESKLARWFAERGIVSKADLMRYGCDEFYLRAWRTCCDFVTEGRARKLTEQECKDLNLTTSMAWYCWLGEPPKTEHEEMKVAERPAFMVGNQFAFL